MSHMAEEQRQYIGRYCKALDIRTKHLFDPANWPASDAATEHRARSNTEAARLRSHGTPAYTHGLASLKISDSPERKRLRQELREVGMKLWVEKTCAPQPAELVLVRHEAGQLSWTTANEQEHNFDITICTMLQEQRESAVPSAGQHSGPIAGTPAIILCELLGRHNDAKEGERSVRLHPLNRTDLDKLWSVMLWVQCRDFSCQSLDGVEAGV